jgi:hypothetical protein
MDRAVSCNAAIHPSVCCQIQAHYLVEIHRGLVGREAQIGRSDLDQLATRPQSGERQRGISTAGDHQV